MYCLSLNLIFDYLLTVLLSLNPQSIFFDFITFLNLTFLISIILQLAYTTTPSILNFFLKTHLQIFLSSLVNHFLTLKPTHPSLTPVCHLLIPTQIYYSTFFLCILLWRPKPPLSSSYPHSNYIDSGTWFFFFSFLGGDMCVSLPTRCTYISLSGLSLGVSICALVYITDSSPSSSSPPLLLSVSVPTSPVRVILVHSSDCRTLTFPESVDGPELWWLLTDCTSYDRLYTVLIPYLICPSSYSPVPPFQFL